MDLLSKNKKCSIGKLNSFSIRNSLTQLIKTATRVTPSSKTLIDHIYCNNPNDVDNAGVITYGTSDHDIVFIILKRNLPKRVKETYRCRNLTNYSLDALRFALVVTDWSTFYGTNSPTRAWHLLYDNYLRALNELAPFVEMRVKTRDSWTNPTLMNLIRTRDKHKLLADRQDADNHDFVEFKKLRGEVKRATVVAKRNFIMSKLDNSRKDSKLYWRELNDILPEK